MCLLVIEARERYATQLVQLNEMGFYDELENIRHLTVTRMFLPAKRLSLSLCVCVVRF
jgi:hypothetical protein